jgi:hypothetical protein
MDYFPMMLRSRPPTRHVSDVHQQHKPTKQSLNLTTAGNGLPQIARNDDVIFGATVDENLEAVAY